MAPAWVVLLEVVLAALQRVHVEEPHPVLRDSGAEPVAEHPLHVVGAPLVGELAGEREVAGVGRLPVQLHERGLDDRVPVEALRLAEELADQVVGEPFRHAEEAGVAGAAAERDRGLDQVPGAVHLVAGRQPGVPRLAGHLEVRIQVAVGELRLLEQAGGPRGELGELWAAAVGELPADGLQGLIDVGVHEHRARDSGRRACPRRGLTGWRAARCPGSPRPRAGAGRRAGSRPGFAAASRAAGPPCQQGAAAGQRPVRPGRRGGRADGAGGRGIRPDHDAPPVKAGKGLAGDLDGHPVRDHRHRLGELGAADSAGHGLWCAEVIQLTDRFAAGSGVSSRAGGWPAPRP